jgi:hypothetical protein
VHAAARAAAHDEELLDAALFERREHAVAGERAAVGLDGDALDAALLAAREDGVEVGVRERRLAEQQPLAALTEILPHFLSLDLVAAVLHLP